MKGCFGFEALYGIYGTHLEDAILSTQFSPIAWLPGSALTPEAVKQLQGLPKWKTEKADRQIPYFPK